MSSTMEQNIIELMPRASVMIEAMRDIGYSFDSAVADCFSPVCAISPPE